MVPVRAGTPSCPPHAPIQNGNDTQGSPDTTAHGAKNRRSLFPEDPQLPWELRGATAGLPPQTPGGLVGRGRLEVRTSAGASLRTLAVPQRGQNSGEEIGAVHLLPSPGPRVLPM